ncbi:MAG: hypothetical protein ACJ72H_24815 [Candidatus Sulfotelmatobacter sp.]
MMRNTAVACLSAALCIPAAFAQNAQANANAATAPVAFVYVSSTPSGKPNVVNAYTAAANGQLTKVPGSPFQDKVASMVVNGKYLLGASTSGIYVEAFQMLSNGALHFVTWTNVAKHNSSGCAAPGDLILDHSGANLYLEATIGGLCDNSEYQSYKLNAQSGVLTFLGSSASSFLFSTPLTFSSNNRFAYGTQCINYQGNYLDTFSVLERDKNGFLTLTGIPQPPPTNNGNTFYCAAGTAADPASHLAVSLQAIEGGSVPTGLPRIASYTIGSSGALSTPTPFSSMPTTTVGDGFSINLSMSPSGKLLAALGDSGLQIFHFNGASKATHYTGLLTTNDIEQAFWDNANHLYAISRNTGKLYVFTATSTSVTQAPGSPYTINAPSNIIVQPR